MRFTDRVTVGQTKRTGEGYLVATARVARTGVQEYLASELGDIAISAGFKPNDVVRVNRPEEEVFSSDALKTITRLPVTVDHPAEDVTSENWGKYSVGDVGDAYARDGEWVVLNPMIKDAVGISAAQNTHKEISMGYNASIVVAADKVIADFDMGKIRYNHLALVPAGRAGPQARIGDSWGAAPINDFHQPGIPPKTEEGGRMSDQLKTIVLGDAAVQVAATDVAAVERYKAASDKVFADAEAKHQTEIAAKDAELAKLQAKLDDAEGKILSDADIDKRVADRADLVSAAKSIVDGIKTAGVSDADIRKAVVAAKFGDESIADKSAAYIDARFDILVEDAKKEGNPVREAIKDSDTNISSLDDSRNAYLARMTRKEA